MAPGGVADGTRLEAEVGDGLAVGRRVVGTRAPVRTSGPSFPAARAPSC